MKILDIIIQSVILIGLIAGLAGVTVMIFAFEEPALKALSFIALLVLSGLIYCWARELN